MDNFLSLLADVGDCINPGNNEKPLKLKTLCGNALMHIAIINGNVIDVISLIRLGISPVIKLSDQKTPLCRAVECGHGVIADVLLANGADIGELTSTGQSFLHYAVTKGTTGVVYALLSAGMSVDQKEADLTPLYRAAERDDFDTAEVLFDCGADIYAEPGLPLVHLAVVRKSANAIRCFADLDFDLDIIDSDLRTPLYRAAEAGDLIIANELKENGADLFIRDKTGFSMLHKAAQEGNVIASKVLLDVGVPVGIKGGCWGSTPLHEAVRSGQLIVAKLLIERGAQVNMKTSDGDTPFAIAQRNCDTVMIEFLKLQRSV